MPCTAISAAALTAAAETLRGLLALEPLEAAGLQRGGDGDIRVRQTEEAHRAAELGQGGGLHRLVAQ